MQFFSQVGQDRFLFENFFYGNRDGVFVDVGAYDGEKFNNTLFFERFMGWRGLCIEPEPSAFAKLVARRKAICQQVCVADFVGEDEFTEAEVSIDERVLSRRTQYFDPPHLWRLQSLATSTETHKVPVTTLSSLLDVHNLRNVDYCSIDTEGSEFNILSGLDFDKFSISMFTIENSNDNERIPNLMAAKGYDCVAKLKQDYVFKRRDIKRLPRSTIICAVWHGDPGRLDLLRGHVANLARQTVPIEAIYIFDGGDAVPSWLEAKAVSVQQPLTIYQAWNVGLSLVQTRLVMNLNLDDRLATNAVELMENTLLRENAFAIGGDWKICYSQKETDDTDQCYPADRLPFVAEWPPKLGTVTRLGSGTGQRGTFGPAVLWRMDAHMGAPRYPWRFADGTQIRLAGDAAWWTILANHLRKKTVRLPMTIGHYYSHPEEQAEFRPAPYDELRMIKDVGVSLI